jgi:hypothetical protein
VNSALAAVATTAAATVDIAYVLFSRPSSTAGLEFDFRYANDRNSNGKKKLFEMSVVEPIATENKT